MRASTGAKRSKKQPTLVQVAEVGLAQIRNVLETEHGKPTIAQVQALTDTAILLLARVKKANGLIDSYALNITSKTGMEAVKLQLLEDAATRHPRIYRLLKGRTNRVR